MTRRATLLAEMGIAPVWKLRAKEAPAEAPAQVPARGWIPLKAAVSGCVKCGLHKTRTQTVFGVGDENADWMLIGEAPGAEEDRLGDPFVGQAGKLLDNMLAAIDLSRRKNVYIANVLKCRPPGNRNPDAGGSGAVQPASPAADRADPAEADRGDGALRRANACSRPAPRSPACAGACTATPGSRSS